MRIFNDCDNNQLNNIVEIESREFARLFSVQLDGKPTPDRRFLQLLGLSGRGVAT